MKQWIAVITIGLLVGCGSQSKEDPGFFTSGSREADQRAEQRMAKAEQQSGQDEKSSSEPSKKMAAEDQKKLTLYDRLGGEKGVKAIVEDFVPRVLADPRVNFERKGVTKGGFTIHRNESVEWKTDAAAVEKFKLHLAQFLAIASGGPTAYGGKEMRQTHAGMHISNAEFDASVGDLKQTLDRLQVPNAEQKELLSIVESTRPQVVEEH